MSLYLDYNASTPVDPRVLDVMVDVYKNHYGNPDSRTHGFGDDAHSIVELSRKQVASLFAVMPSEVFFTSGSTESNNIAVQGLEQYARQSGKNHLITSSIEHKAVIESVKAMERKGFRADYIRPEKSGIVCADTVLGKVTSQTVLVSIMHVNNETGIIQPVDILGEALESQDIFFHVDATQSSGKLVEELRSLKYSMLSFSAHKMGGPQGVGVLILRKKRYKLPPVKNIMYGGQQEGGIRPGTIPVALVAGCGKACELAENEYSINQQKCKNIQEILLNLLRDSGLNWSINGDIKYCISNTLNICLHGVSSEALMLSSKMHCGISNGSACTSKDYRPSYVLTSMGLTEKDSLCSVRISWGPKVDKDIFKNEVSTLLDISKKLCI
ncbi:MAG: cysteine desulfurase [Clostridia bacterium]|nr:cysteine desulfurase [Clostridia bacterium]